MPRRFGRGGEAGLIGGRGHARTPPARDIRPCQSPGPPGSDAAAAVRTGDPGHRRPVFRVLDLGASLAGAPQLLLARRADDRARPGERNEVWDAVREMSWGGTDILLTTQYLDEADHLAAHIVIIDGGRVIAQGTPDELKSRVGADIIELHAADVPTMQQAAEVLGSLGMAEPATDSSTRRASIAAPAGARLLPIVVRALDDAGVPVEDIALRRPTLDEVFLELTGHTTGEGTTEGRDDEDKTEDKNHGKYDDNDDEEDAA